MAKKKKELKDDFYSHYNILTGEAAEKRLAEIRLLSAMEEHSALETARQEGTKKGMEQGIKEGKEQGIKEGKEQGIKEGKEQGIKEGKIQAIKETAKKLKEMNLDIESIMKATGLSRKEIEEI